MPESIFLELSRLPLRGARIWLSGSIPDEADDSARESILRFVSGLCDRVFADGGSIIHGSHPSLRGPILERARLFRGEHGPRDRLKLVYSRWFATHPDGDPPRPEDWRRDALVYETPEVDSEVVKNSSAASRSEQSAIDHAGLARRKRPSVLGARRDRIRRELRRAKRSLVFQSVRLPS